MGIGYQNAFALDMEYEKRSETRWSLSTGKNKLKKKCVRDSGGPHNAKSPRGANMGGDAGGEELMMGMFILSRAPSSKAGGEQTISSGGNISS